MIREDVFEKLNVIFRDVFYDDEISLTDTTSAADIEDWDSLSQVNILLQIEKEFSIRFDVGETNSLKNVGDIVDLILKKEGGKS